jgi:hypothetical protein
MHHDSSLMRFPALWMADFTFPEVCVIHHLARRGCHYFVLASSIEKDDDRSLLLEM